MCHPASMIVTKGNRVHWSENAESHSEIIKELGLRETDARGDVALVPIEIQPPAGDLTTPISKWVFGVDFAGYSRDLPEWWDADKAEAAVRAALKAWKKQKVITGTVKELTAGQYYVCGKAHIGSVRGSATIEYVGGSATIEDVGGSATIKDVRDSATIEYVGDSATIIVYTTIDPQCLKSKTAVMIDRSKTGSVSIVVGVDPRKTGATETP